MLAMGVSTRTVCLIDMYAELVAVTNHSFLHGASHPEELVREAAQKGLAALAITDIDGLYGAVKAHQEAQTLGLKLVIGALVTLLDGPPIALYAQTLHGYGNLVELISRSRLSHPKGGAGLLWRDVAARAQDVAALLPSPLVGQRPISPSHPAIIGLAEAFSNRFFIGRHRDLSPLDGVRDVSAAALAEALGVVQVAHNDVRFHVRSRKPLHDVVTCIRHHTTLAQARTLLSPNAEACLKGPDEMRALFADAPEVVAASVAVAQTCHFSLSQVRYEFSREDLPDGQEADGYLAQLVTAGVQTRYPDGPSEAVAAQLRKELMLIAQLGYAGYFIALWDIVRFARSRDILCQGRGSAANSAVCYVLGITSIDPVRMGLLFERFLSMERKEPPDIDVDFEHHRREEVIQYVYEKHGRHRAAMVANLICYRGRSAVRDVGKVLGLATDQFDRLAKALDLGGEGVGDYQLAQAGLQPSDPLVQQVLVLTEQLAGTPRHLGIHVGGFAITHGPLVRIAPVENASMEGRSVVQWDKDDLSALDILKVDLLGLGMLSAIARCFSFIKSTTGRRYSMATVPAEDPHVYDMVCAGDTIGVFQIESRAQQNMLPRLQPRCFYDLVVEIAIIRPGPIVGEMVHPYLRRRNGEEPVTYPSEEVRDILSRTLGVPLFQEQAMRLAMVAAGFSAGDADRLRRVLSNKRAEQLLPQFRDRFVEGCVRRGYERQFAENCFNSFRGFSHYGFPESHSASFALICYVSCWLKHYYPAAFCAALLDSQPMGFYSAHTLVDDAKRHGVQVRPIDINSSRWHSVLESQDTDAEHAEPKGAVPAQPALRLGLSLVKGLHERTAQAIVAARAQGPFTSVADVARRSHAPRFELTRLVLAGALGSLSADRRHLLWQLHALGPFDSDDLFFGMPMADDAPHWPQPDARERVETDFSATGLSLESHPVGLLRPQLMARGALTAAALAQSQNGQRAKMGGLVIVRQRPPTAKGFTFLSLEDETGIANVVVHPTLFDRYRQEICGTALLLSSGRVERSGAVVNLKVDHLERLTL
jgi:error-prone DNA polymerase